MSGRSVPDPSIVADAVGAGGDVGGEGGVEGGDEEVPLQGRHPAPPPLPPLLHPQAPHSGFHSKGELQPQRSQK